MAGVRSVGPKMQRRGRVLSLLAAALLLTGFSGCPGGVTEVEEFPEGEVPCTVSRVIDGDTFSCVQGGRRVRLLGIDAPESGQWMGPLATDMARALMPIGTRMRLVLGARSTDEFGRTLAWAYVESSNLFVNEQMVILGYADLFVNSSDRRFEGSFQAHLAEAQALQRGLWNLGFLACRPWAFKSTGQDCPRP